MHFGSPDLKTVQICTHYKGIYPIKGLVIAGAPAKDMAFAALRAGLS
jgi:hypothetical protein